MATESQGFTQYIVIKSLGDYRLDDATANRSSRIFNMNFNSRIYIAGKKRSEGHMDIPTGISISEVFKYYDLVGNPITDKTNFYFYFKLKKEFPAISEEEIARLSPESITDPSGGSRVRKFPKKTQKNKKYKKSLK
jgi:hypothetical protein